jgi:serine/threonine protein kinase
MEKAELGGGNRKVASAMEAYEKLEKVGEGTYGKVYRARERATGKIVALKKTRLHEDDEGVPPTTLREVSILRMLSCDPHVVRSTHYSPLISSLLCLVLVLLHLWFFYFSTLFKSHFSVWSFLDGASKIFPISLNPTLCLDASWLGFIIGSCDGALCFHFHGAFYFVVRGLLR